MSSYDQFLESQKLQQHLSLAIEKYSSLQFNNQINTFIGFYLRHYEYGNCLTKELISKQGNPYTRNFFQVHPQQLQLSHI